MERFLAIPELYDLGATLGALQHGAYDPTTRVSSTCAWRAIRTSAGTATVRYVREPAGVRVTAWGIGAERALEDAPDVLGLSDDPAAFRPAHPLMSELARRFVSIRFPKTRSIFEPLIPGILEQKVTSSEALRSYRLLVHRYGEPAPGNWPLLVAPETRTLAGLPYHALHRMGVERKRADIIRHACARATRLNEASSMQASDARARLQALPGIGPWTAAEVTRVSHGDPDAVSVGDYHLPNMVAWALAGEPRADDARMLELLEPFRGHRARVILLLAAAGFRAPAFGPRKRLRQISAI